MAKAVANFRTVEKVVIQAVPVRDGVVLELTGPEAEALAMVLSKVGGAPDKSARGHVAEVSDALHGAGYHFTAWDVEERKRILTGSLFFTAHLPTRS